MKQKETICVTDEGEIIPVIKIGKETEDVKVITAAADGGKESKE